MLLAPATFPAPDDSAVSPCSSPSHKQSERAKNSAAGYLARRPHSRQELERKLHEKGHDAKAVQQALERLAELVSMHLLERRQVRCAALAAEVQRQEGLAVLAQADLHNTCTTDRAARFSTACSAVLVQRWHSMQIL